MLSECFGTLLYGEMTGTLHINLFTNTCLITCELMLLLMIVVCISYIRKRSGFYGMMESLGIKQKHRNVFILIEYSGVFLVSLGIGLPLGYYIANNLFNLLREYFPQYAMHFQCSISTWRITIIVGIILFGIMFFVMDEIIACFGIDALLNMGKSSGKPYIKKKITLFGILMLMISFMSMWGYWGKRISILPVYIALIGLYILMYSGVGEYLKKVELKKECYYKNILWINNWYHRYFYNLNITFVIAAFLFIANYYYAINLVDNIPFKIDEYYPYDIVWMANDDDREFIVRLEQKHNVQIDTKACIRITTGDIAEQIGISSSVYEQWTGEKLDIQDKEIFIVYQRDRKSINNLGIDYDNKNPRIYIGMPNSDLWMFVKGESIPTNKFNNDYSIVGWENRILTGVFQDTKSENVIVFSDEEYKKIYNQSDGANLIVMIRCQEVLKDVKNEITNYAKGKSEENYFSSNKENLIYIKDTLTLEMRVQYLLELTCAISNIVLLFLCAMCIYLLKLENDALEMESKYKLYIHSGINKKLFIKYIKKEISITNKIAIFFVIVASVIFWCGGIYVKKLNSYWTSRYVILLLLIFGTVILLSYIIQSISTFKWIGYFKRRNKNE